MKKTLFCAMFLPMALQAQVGINTNDPKATLEVKKNTHIPNTQPQGVLFPRFTSEERLKFSGTAEVGTMIYNTDKSCIEIYQGVVSGVHQWTCMPGSNQTQSVVVTAAGFEGSYVGGVAFTSANKAKFKLENNSFGNISSAFHDAVSFQNGSATITMANCQWQKLNGATLTGSVAQCTSGNLINLNSGESAMLWYTMGGTPETGTLKANFNKLGAQADQQTQVGLGSATITSPKTEYVVSLTYDGTVPATEVQGKINNTTDKLIVKIPYKNGSGSYEAVTSTVNTALGEGDDTNTLTLNIPAGNFGATGSLDATITVGGGDGEYLVKMLPPGQEYEIATIPYTLNGQSYQLVLKGIGGIPDRCFGKTTLDCVGYGANELEHQFIYVPIKGPDGRTWLNNNLGAEYARVGSQWFNPTRQAGALDYTNTTATVPLSNPTTDQIKRDWRAFGSLFQWQRNPDGHELITWTSSTSGTPKYIGSSSLSSSWTNPGHSIFIASYITWYSVSFSIWVHHSLVDVSTQKDLWRSSGTDKTNPCPSGYHVPTSAEYQTLKNAIGVGLQTWNERELRLPVNGFRASYDDGKITTGGNGRYWSSDPYWSNNPISDKYYAASLKFSSAGIFFTNSGYPIGMGHGVRCIKDN
ncbi:FISUMP domain-containing protein [Riemerella anatipestifer]|nr:FISUMP domain-containing protein [Riemerella anatipestifer]MDY3325176.1 FISUMP domain-containing protein [Riemerella anatipestifer]MDY3352835.1 FISUMP domain-containing protein [Riemerella anatipestifer]